MNVFGYSQDEYVAVVSRLNGCEGIDAYELNISCPNTEQGGMVFGTREDATRELVARVRERSDRPLFVKLSPNVTDIGEIAGAAQAGGADALTVANTYLAMAIDSETFRPRLKNVTGGLSGPSIRPITLRMVYETARAVQIPVIGLGGIASGSDAIEYLLAGASAIQVGTAHFEDPGASVRIVGEIEQFMRRKGIGTVSEIVGGMRP